MTETTTNLNEFAQGVQRRIQSSLGAQAEVFEGERLGQIAIFVVLIYVLMAIFAPLIAPYEPQQMHKNDDGTIKQMEAPSASHPFGTTRFGRDVLSQVIFGARVSVFVGFVAAFASVIIGTFVGIVSGYYGGWIDAVLMRLVDVLYGIPFIPLMIVLVIFLGPGILNITIAIASVNWLSTSRVIRSQVLSIKERPYIEAAHAIGPTDRRILVKHILPNVFPIILLYGAFGVGWAILGEASVSFIGFGDPEMVSWGKMIFQAFATNSIRHAWWWVLPAGISISLLVISTFLIARTYEKVSNPELRSVR